MQGVWPHPDTNESLERTPSDTGMWTVNGWSAHLHKIYKKFIYFTKRKQIKKVLKWKQQTRRRCSSRDASQLLLNWAAKWTGQFREPLVLGLKILSIFSLHRQCQVTHRWSTSVAWMGLKLLYLIVGWSAKRMKTCLGWWKVQDDLPRCKVQQPPADFNIYHQVLSHFCLSLRSDY